MTSFTPPFIPLNELDQHLSNVGFGLLNPQAFFKLTNHTQEEWDLLKKSWNELPPDNYLKDGGRYRKRRHASVIIHSDSIEQAPHRPHWQPVSYNALHGGIDRWFEPCEKYFLSSPNLNSLLTNLAHIFWKNKGINPQNHPWFVEVHQFRIDTKDGIGRPTPEGAHRDGVDFVAVLLVDRKNIKGGESRIFLADQAQGQRFTLDQSWSLVLLDDLKIIHETTPIQPIQPEETENSWRDTLVLTFRLNNFQDKVA